MMPFPPPFVPFALNLWVAARLLPLFAKRRPLDELLRRATPQAGRYAFADRSSETIIAAVKAVVARPWRMRGRRCLREGLLAFHYLALAGRRPLLHFGLVPRSALTPRPRAHCWITLDGAIVLNAPVEPMLDLFACDGRQALPAQQAMTLAAATHD
jgi:hypothetical protein